MRWLADECVSAPLVAWLREEGHDVLYVMEVAPGSTDEQVMRIALHQGRVLLTEDKDFGDLVFHHGGMTHGIVLVRINSAMGDLKQMRLKAAIEHFREGLADRYVIVEEGRFRARRLPL